MMKKCYTHLNIFFTLCLALFICFAPELLHAQNAAFDSQTILENSIFTQKTGMKVLGSWALANILSGSIGYYRASGDLKYFHQMNAAWNIVNLGIAGIGYYGIMQTDLSMSHDLILTELQSFDKILLINAGLDLLYISTGVWLWKRGHSKQQDRLMGYGKSISLQGGFLLAFDIGLYLIHSKFTDQMLSVGNNLALKPGGFTYYF